MTARWLGILRALTRVSHKPSRGHAIAREALRGPAFRAKARGPRGEPDADARLARRRHGRGDPLGRLGLEPGIDLGFFTLRYYSLAYLAGIVLAYWHLSKMIKAPGSPMAQRHADDLFFYCTLGIILGGRLGYAAFYTARAVHPLHAGQTVSWDLLRLWDGGMSFHGGRDRHRASRSPGSPGAASSASSACATTSRSTSASACCSGGSPTSSTASCGAVPSRRAVGDDLLRRATPTAVAAAPSEPALRGAARRRAGDRGHAAAVLEDPRALPPGPAGRRVHRADRARRASWSSSSASPTTQLAEFAARDRPVAWASG